MDDQSRDARIQAIYYILIPFVVLTIISLFVALLSWNVASSKPDVEIQAITVSLTIIEIVLAIFAIMLGVVAIFGFWAVRGAAVASAKAEARRYLDDKAAQMFGEVKKLQQRNGGVEAPDIPTDMNEAEVMEQAVEEEDQK